MVSFSQQTVVAATPQPATPHSGGSQMASSGHQFVEQSRAVMMEAACTPEAAVRFLQAVGYEEFAPAVERLQISLTTLALMPMLDLERKLGVTPKKAVVALFDECGKLRRCLNRSSAAVELPTWLPAVLSVPAELIEPSAANGGGGRGSPPRRAQSARGPRIGPGRPTPSGGGHKTARPLSSNERVRMLMSGIKPPPDPRARAAMAVASAEARVGGSGIGGAVPGVSGME